MGSEVNTDKTKYHQSLFSFYVVKKERKKYIKNNIYLKSRIVKTIGLWKNGNKIKSNKEDVELKRGFNGMR